MKAMIDAELDILHREVIVMGALCEKSIESAAKALLEGDAESANMAIATEVEINKKERDIEDLCLKLLLKQHPVAKDLRKISATLKMLTDMERIGDQARDIAEIVLSTDLSAYKNNSHIQDIAAATIKMVTDIVDAYVQNDLQLCSIVIQYDEVVDDLFEDIKADIIHIVMADRDQVESGMYLLMIAKYFERIGDHACNIAEWVEFSIIGKHRGVEL